jgi:CrcB protein
VSVHLSALDWLLVAGLGGAGAIVRFLLDGAVGERFAGAFPLGTFAVNISGALTLGLLNGLALSGQALLLAGTATIGSYTTFSTWMLETERLVEDGELASAAANLALSVVVGVAAAALGRRVGALL